MEITSACELFHRCLDRRGGEEWREFHRRFNPRIRRTVLRAFLERGVRLVKPDLDEFVQDLYCRLLVAGKGGFRGHSESQLWSYLGRVARSVALDHRRSLRARKRRSQIVAPEPGRDRRGGDCPRRDGADGDRPERQRRRRAGRAAPPDSIDEIAARQVSPEERCLVNEYRRLILRRCRKLSRNDRSVTMLRLAVLEGWTSREICHRFGGGMTPGQVDLMVYRLRRRLAKEGIRLPSRREWEPTEG